MEQAETAADEMPAHPAKGFFGLDIRLIVLLFLSALCLYMLVYVNTPSAEKKTRRLFNLCGIIFSFLPSVIACLLLFDAVRAIFGLQDARLYLIPLALGIAVSGYGFVHAKKGVYEDVYTGGAGRQKGADGGADRLRSHAQGSVFPRHIFHPLGVWRQGILWSHADRKHPQRRLLWRGVSSSRFALAPTARWWRCISGAVDTGLVRQCFILREARLCELPGIAALT